MRLPVTKRPAPEPSGRHTRRPGRTPRSSRVPAVSSPAPSRGGDASLRRRQPRVVRLGLFGTSHGPFGGVEIAHGCVGVGDAEERIAEQRIDLERLLEAPARLEVAALLAEDHAPVERRHRVARVGVGRGREERIGLGGAPDVQTALFYDAKHVDAVDINRTTIEIVRGPFRDFLGDPYGQSQVHTHQMDGRTFVRQTPRTYDLIQMSGVDTKAILASGTLAVNESYVYTREAIRDILERLRPNGMLAFIRAGDADAHRLTAIAVDGLRALGEPHPEKHVFVVAQGLFRGVLVSRKPFTEEDLARLHAWVGRREGAPPDIVMLRDAKVPIP